MTCWSQVRPADYSATEPHCFLICYINCMLYVCTFWLFVLLCPRPHSGGIKRWCASDVWRLSVAYIGHKSRTGRPRKTEIGTEVAHVTRDSDRLWSSPLKLRPYGAIEIRLLLLFGHHFQGQRSTCRGVGILWRPPAQFVYLVYIGVLLSETNGPDLD